MRSIHIIILILCFFTEVVYSQVNTVPEIKFSREQINYIYNRSLELMVLDRRANNYDMSEGLPFKKQLINFDSIRFYICSSKTDINTNPDLPYKLKSARPLNADFDLQESSMFTLFNAKLIELEPNGNFDYYRSMLPGVSNIALLSFSDLYVYNNFIYISVDMIYLLKSDFYFYPSECTFQIELCNDRIPIFKLGFYSQGITDNGLPIINTFNFNEIDCN
ncbi:MAG: hypothetical protein KA807_17395 [Prolixibacteraceae bacterium]|nr:hypothetical protein [Prolixibacteraceae bacterium]